MESKPQIPSPRPVSDPEAPSIRVGQFHVVRQLVSGPGAQVFEACAEDGSQVILQVTRCRAAKVHELETFRVVAGRAERAALERGALTVGQEVRDGETLVYFALRWDDRAARLGSIEVDGDDELISIGIYLAKRLYDLHRAHQLDPLLSERFIVHERGVPSILVLPIRIADAWLAPGMRPARLAPEETLAKEPTKAGDIWRLGQTLKALTANLDRLPTRIWRALELLGHPDIGIRIRTAEDSLAMLEALTDPNTPDPPSESDLTRARHPRASSGMAVTMMEPVEAGAHAIDDVATLSDQPLVAGPRRLPRADTDPTAGVDGATTDPMGVPRPNDTVHDVDGLAHRNISDAAAVPRSAIPEMRRKRATSWVPSAQGPTGTVMDVPPRALAKRRTNTTPGDLVNQLGQRLLPPPSALGPSGTLVGEVEAPIPARAPRVEEDVPEAEERQEPAAEISSSRLWATAFLTFVLGLALGAVVLDVMEALEDSDLLGPIESIDASGSVYLEASPASAIVVGEQDGRILGATPLELQVPATGEVVVLVAAPLHEPMRVILPNRGRITATLAPSPEPDPCIINLHVPGGAPVEGVADAPSDVASGLEVMGAAVIRTTDGRGAWLVRCPSLGGEGVQTLEGRTLPEDAEVRVSRPVDMEVWVDGTLAGTSPVRKRMTPGFKLIRITSGKGTALERWVPVFADLDLELPNP